MENATTKTSSRKGKNLKFDQEWKDAVDRLPKHYRDEICAAIEAYQRDLTIIEVTPECPAPYSCSSCPQSVAATAPVNCDALPAPAKTPPNPHLHAPQNPRSRQLLNRHTLSHSLSFNNKNPAEASSTSCSAAERRDAIHRVRK